MNQARRSLFLKLFRPATLVAICVMIMTFLWIGMTLPAEFHKWMDSSDYPNNSIAGVTLGGLIFGITSFVLLFAVMDWEEKVVGKALNAVLTRRHCRIFRKVRQARPRRLFYGSVTAIPDNLFVPTPTSPEMRRHALSG